MTIIEIKVPLTLTTVYSRKQRLIYAAGKHQWSADTSKPPDTIVQLNCADSGNNLCELRGMTFSQLTGMLGYAWRSASTVVVDCALKTGNVQTYQLQNIFTGANPDDALKTLAFTDTSNVQQACGFRTSSHLVYDLMGPKDGTGNNFYVDATADGYHLRKLVLDKTKGQLNTASGQSFGRFALPLDSMVMHPSGYVIGASFNNHKVEVLTLPGEAYPDSDAPMARMLCGRGLREGLLFGPVAVAMTSSGAILVLESLNRRIQAIDVNGDPLTLFGPNKDQCVVSLIDGPDENVKYLDLGVEFEGYVYVLSYVSDGSSPDHYRLDIYSPEGLFVCRTVGVAAGRLVVDLWRTMYTLGFGSLAGPQGRIEPVVSEWIPSTPQGESP